MASKQVERVTMFKIARKEDRDEVLEAYNVLKQTNSKVPSNSMLFCQRQRTRFTNVIYKDGKQYILACEAGHAADEPRAQGWTLVSKTTFASKSDMDYYDTECEAHKALKKVARPVRTDIITVWFESATRG
ncbi:hypothetical protein LTR08_003623 [Meristemomyces frigidus]|nr:hypothetical protein LTR08_003623 [Meristemomyces frigidus]